MRCDAAQVRKQRPDKSCSWTSGRNTLLKVFVNSLSIFATSNKILLNPLACHILSRRCIRHGKPRNMCRCAWCDQKIKLVLSTPAKRSYAREPENPALIAGWCRAVVFGCDHPSSTNLKAFSTLASARPSPISTPPCLCAFHVCFVSLQVRSIR